jgi:autotransporter-associated beta strand protein
MRWSKHFLLAALAPGVIQAADFTWSNSGNTVWSSGAWSGAGTVPNGSGDNIATPAAYGRADLTADYVVGNFTYGTEIAKATSFWQIVPQNAIGLRKFEISGTLSVADNGESVNDLIFRNTTNGTLSVKVNEINSAGRLFFGQNEASILMKLEVTGLTQVTGRLLSVTALDATFGEVRITEPTPGVSSVFRVSNYRTTNSTFGVTVAGLSGNAGSVQAGNAQAGQVVTGTLKIDTQAGTSYSYTGTLADNITAGTNHLAVVKQGSGTQAVGGANFYSGGTRIEAGTLLVTNTDPGTSGLGTGEVLVQNSGILGGGGYIALGGTNSVTVAAGGLIAPGEGLGTLTFNGASTTGPILVLSSGAAFSFDLGAGNTSDQVAFWNYGGSGDFLLSDTVIHFTGAQSGTYTLFTFYSDSGTTATASGLSSGFNVEAFTGLDGYEATLNYGESAITLTLTAVPEPGVSALLAGAGVLALLRRKKRTTK